MKPYVAGVDSSTQSVKIVIMDPITGQVVREGRACHPQGTEVDPKYWWEAFLTAVEEASGLDDVRAISFGGQQHGMVCLDKNGEVIRPALLWNDTRSAQAGKDLVKELGSGDEALGVKEWVYRTGSVPVASITITKLRWLADHEPDNAAKIAAVCLPHDWLSWKFSGSTRLEDLATDRSDASGTGYFKTPSADQSYDYSLLARALRISEAEAHTIQLPRVAGPREVIGHGDADHGWNHIAIGPGCGDNAGAALGLELSPGEAMLSLGTSGVVALRSDKPIVDPEGIITGFADATGQWLPLACTLNASRIIDAMAAVLGVDYQQFSELALSVDSARGLELTPYFEGERTPNLPNATASLTGMTLDNYRPAYVARASVEGLLSLMRGAMDAMRSAGAEVTKVQMVGGGAKLEAVRVLAPDILGVEVEVPEASEYVALGAARQAAMI